MTDRPLSDVRVLDFGHYLAGPLVGMMLADLGADVLRVDPPGGPRWDDPSVAMLGRGKRTIELDLKSPSGAARATELAAVADVVIENFRPGVMDRLGLGPTHLRTENPGLVYLSLPGFASTDPELADLPAWEAVIGAVTGQFTDMGLNRRLMGINPSFTPLGLASAYGASLGATAVLLALAARARCGGDHIEVPLASALLEGLAYNAERIEDYPDRYKSPREVELERRAEAGEPLDLAFEDLSELLDPFYRTYSCADGRGFYVVAGSVASHPPRVLKTLGLEHLLEELPSFSAYLDAADWPDEWTLANYPVGDRDRARVSGAMNDAFATRPAAEWERLLGDAQAPATKQRTTEEWLADEHALASGLVLEVDDPEYGTMRQMGNVAWLADDTEAVRKRSPMRSDVGWEARAVDFGTDRGGWLDGLKVLDLTNVIAGPTIGSTLARFGAEVISVQPVIPSVDPWNTIVFGLLAQRGKESILLDLSSDRGRDALDRLIRSSDVITFNGTDAQRDRLGLSPERLAEIDPALILVQLDAFGGPSRGPKSDDLGYDDLAQAATGVMLRFGGGMSTPEEHAHFGTIDVLTGFCATVALGAALVRRERTGLGGVARASLAAAGNLIQSQFMYDYDGRPPFDEPAGREAIGWGPWYRCYEAADGWMFVGAPTDDGRERLSEFGADEDELTAAFAGATIGHWQALLTGSSAAAVPLGSLMDTRDGSLVRESDGPVDLSEATFRVIRHDQHPMGRWVDLVAPNAVRPAHARITIPGPMPKYGEHTRAVLRRIGFDQPTIDDMLATGDAAEQWSDRYLPE